MAEQNRKYRVIVSKKAADMLVSHAVFLAGVSASAAESLISSFESAAGSLEELPYRCPWLMGEYIPRNVYRKLLFEGRYLMIYQIKDDTVYVDYVVDCRQDYRWLTV